MIKIDTTHFNSDKIIDFNTAIKKISELKKANKTVGLCHGGFDLLHPGHIKHLESAAKLCDCLFVSITSDKFVASRKGKHRPIFSEKLRAYSVASIQYVAYVIITDFERAIEIIEKLKPTYYIKGPDFFKKTTPGIVSEKNKITEVGGEIKYTSDQKLSTTDIIKYIQQNAKSEKVLLCIDRDGTLIDDVKFLGKDKNWIEQIKLKKDVIDFLNHIQAKCDTTKIVISNQQGVARGYFDIETVESINKQIDRLLRKKGILIDNWQYCPEVDASYATSVKDIVFKPEFIKDKTIRKPSPEMLYNALRKLNMNINDFAKVVIIGDSQDDADFAKNIGAAFIDVTNKNYESLKKEFNNI